VIDPLLVRVRVIFDHCYRLREALRIAPDKLSDKRSTGGQFPFAFDRLWEEAKVQPLRTPPVAPNANAFAEAWIGSIKRECLDYFLCFSLGHLDYLGQKYVQYHNYHRPHQGLGNRTVPEAATGSPRKRSLNMKNDVGRVRCRRFLGGLLRHYYRAA
jgi:putative transposase